MKKFYPREDQRGYHYLVCLDGSDKSWKGFETAAKISQHEKDIIYGCYVPNPDDKKKGEEIKGKYEVFKKEKAIAKAKEFLILPPTYDYDKAINDFINTNEKYNFDFVVVNERF